MYQFELKPFRRTQWGPVQELEKEFEKMFDVFTKHNEFAPACEITDEEKFYSIGIDVPGFTQDELEIEVKDNYLTVSGERKAPARSEKASVLRSERRYGKFSRVFTLPQHANADGIEARFENGVLEIVVPKEEKTQPKKILISGWKKQDVPSELKS